MSRHSPRARRAGASLVVRQPRLMALAETLENRTFLSVAPSAAFAGPTVTKGGDSAYSFGIIYAGDAGVDPTSLNNANIVVKGPGGFSRQATLVSVDSNTPARIIAGIYSIVPPHGSFDPSSNATYTVSINALQVKDVDGNFVRAGDLGTFDSNVAATALVNNQLQVNGTAGTHSINVSPSGSNISVSIDGVVSFFPANSVTSLRVSLGHGVGAIADTTALPATLFGARGTDTISAGGGDDLIIGGPGHDSIVAGSGDDTIRGRRGNDTMRGGSGHDSIRGGRGDTQIFAGTGGDTILTGIGSDTVFAHNGVADTITGNGVNGIAHVDAGLDLITGVQSVLNT